MFETYKRGMANYGNAWELPSGEVARIKALEAPDSIESVPPSGRRFADLVYNVAPLQVNLSGVIVDIGDVSLIDNSSLMPARVTDNELWTHDADEIAATDAAKIAITAELRADTIAITSKMNSDFNALTSEIRADTVAVTSLYQTNSEQLSALLETNSENLSALYETNSEQLSTLLQTNSENLSSLYETNSEQLSTLLQTNSEQFSGLYETNSENLTSLIQSSFQNLSSNDGNLSALLQANAENLTGLYETNSENLSSVLFSAQQAISAELVTINANVVLLSSKFALVSNSKIISSVGGYTYIADAIPGSLSSTAVWRIKQIDSGGTSLWADGNANFDNVASDMLTKTYTL